MANPHSQTLNFRGRTAGAFAPLLVFFLGVTWLGLLGAPAETGFWPVVMAALMVGLLLSRDRYQYCETLIEGMSKPIVMMMIMAWMLAGVLGALMKASGFVEALVWSAEQLGVEGTGYVLAAFLISCAVSTATGTSLGTIILCSPLLYPAGGLLDAQPALLMGAILGGATFGDNLSPISDTTIASTITQGANMSQVVRSRLIYALPAALIAVACYWLAGSSGIAESAVMDGSTQLKTIADNASENSPRGLPMILAPALSLFLLLRRRHLIEGLMLGILAAITIGIILGLLTPQQLLHIDADAYSAGGLLVEGMKSGIGVSIFTILLMGLVRGLEASGALGRIFRLPVHRADSPRAAEVWAFGSVSAATLLTTHSVVALLTVGPFVHRTGQRLGIRAERRANILDVTVCTYPFLLPYCIPTLLAASTTAGGESFGMPKLSAFEIGIYNFHSWALLAVIIFAVATGWGRGPLQAQPQPKARGLNSPSPTPTPRHELTQLIDSPSSEDQTEKIDLPDKL